MMQNPIDPALADRLVETACAIVRALEDAKLPKRVTMAAWRAEDACRALADALWASGAG
jgi:hypothetical protein